MVEIVALLGVIGSGKSYRAKQFVEQGYMEINFADALKEMASAITGVDATTEEFKEMVFVRVNSSIRIVDNFIDKTWLGVEESFTGRQFLQNLATELRKADPDIFFKLWKPKSLEAIRSGKSIVVADCRFINEARELLFHSYYARPRFIFCNYKSDRYDPGNPHESEHLAQMLIDCVDGQELTLDQILAFAHFDKKAREEVKQSES